MTRYRTTKWRNILRRPSRSTTTTTPSWGLSSSRMLWSTFAVYAVLCCHPLVTLSLSVLVVQENNHSPNSPHSSWAIKHSQSQFLLPTLWLTSELICSNSTSSVVWRKKAFFSSSQKVKLPTSVSLCTSTISSPRVKLRSSIRWKRRREWSIRSVLR